MVGFEFVWVCICVCGLGYVVLLLLLLNLALWRVVSVLMVVVVTGNNSGHAGRQAVTWGLRGAIYNLVIRFKCMYVVKSIEIYRNQNTSNGSFNLSIIIIIM